MKLLLLMLLATSAFAVGSISNRVIHNDDYISSTFLRLNLDGILLWEYDLDVRQAKIEEFKDKCLNEIPLRVENNFSKLYDSIDFLKRHDIDASYKIISKFYRGYGEQLICQSRIKSGHPELINFKAHYSEIYTDNENGTIELCRQKIAQIDETAVANNTLTRRAYFDYKYRNGQHTYPSCQTLSIEIVSKD